MLKEYWGILYGVVQENAWLIESIAIVFLTWCFYVIWRRSAIHLIEKSKRKGYVYSEIIWKASRSPVSTLIIAFGGISCCLTPFPIDSEVFSYLNVTRELIMVGIVSWVCMKVIGQIETEITTGQLIVVNPTRLTTVLNGLKLVVIFMSIGVVLQIFGYSLTGLAAVGSVSAIVLGFASKTWIENLLGYATIRANKKYSLGDWIEIPDLNVSGTVESMTISSTNLRDMETKLISVPNGLFLTKHVNNLARLLNRQVVFEIPVSMSRYEDVPSALKNVKKVLAQDERVDANKRILSNITVYDSVNGYLMTRIDFYLKCTQLEQFYSERQECFLKMMAVFKKSKIELAVRTMGNINYCERDVITACEDTLKQNKPDGVYDV